MAMDMDQRWVNRAPDEMFQTFHRFQGEGFDLIVEDLSLMSERGKNVIAEGLSLIPRLVAPLLKTKAQAVWLVPTPEFRVRAIEARGGTWSIAGRTSDPDRALANLRARDELLVERSRGRSSRSGFRHWSSMGPRVSMRSRGVSPTSLVWKTPPTRNGSGFVCAGGSDQGRSQAGRTYRHPHAMGPTGHRPIPRDTSVPI